MSNGSSFVAAPTLVADTGHGLTDAADQLNQLRTDVLGSQLPKGAFGLLPVSDVASDAQAACTRSVSHDLEIASSGVGRLGTAVVNSGTTYARADLQSAGQIQNVKTP
jgi:hypothetical protein